MDGVIFEHFNFWMELHQAYGTYQEGLELTKKYGPTNYQKLVEFHKENNSLLTIALHNKRVKLDLGIVKLNGDFQVVEYNEKPTMDYFNSMGIYVYEPQVLKYITRDEYLDLPALGYHELFCTFHRIL